MSEERSETPGHRRVPAPPPEAVPAEDADGLPPERIAELHRRIAEGAYDAPAMAERLARLLLDSGDV